MSHWRFIWEKMNEADSIAILTSELDQIRKEEAKRVKLWVRLLAGRRRRRRDLNQDVGKILRKKRLGVLCKCSEKDKEERWQGSFFRKQATPESETSRSICSNLCRICLTNKLERLIPKSPSTIHGWVSVYEAKGEN